MIRHNSSTQLVLIYEDLRKKRRLLITMAFSLGITQTLYLNIPVFLPEYRAQHHPSINDGEVGIIIA
jgi:hypothetical protein